MFLSLKGGLPSDVFCKNSFLSLNKQRKDTKYAEGTIISSAYS